MRTTDMFIKNVYFDILPIWFSKRRNKYCRITQGIFTFNVVKRRRTPTEDIVQYDLNSLKLHKIILTKIQQKKFD